VYSTADLSQYRHNFDTVSKQLEQAIRVKFEKEELLNDKVKQLQIAQEVINEKDAQIDRVKKEVDKISKRLTDMEQRNDELDIKKRSIEKQQQV
jgi:uncharacterized protein YoxC